MPYGKLSRPSNRVWLVALLILLLVILLGRASHEFKSTLPADNRLLFSDVSVEELQTLLCEDRQLVTLAFLLFVSILWYFSCLINFLHAIHL